MKQLLIRRVKYTEGGLGSWIAYEVESDGVVVQALCWDEMLGVFAIAFLQDRLVMGTTSRCKVRVEWELRIEKINSSQYTIHRGDEFIDHLTFAEALGFLARFTLTGEEMYGGFRNYDAWLDHCRAWNPGYKIDIHGALPAPTTI